MEGMLTLRSSDEACWVGKPVEQHVDKQPRLLGLRVSANVAGECPCRMATHALYRT